MNFLINGKKFSISEVSDKFLKDEIASIHIMTIENVSDKRGMEEELAFRARNPEYSIAE